MQECIIPAMYEGAPGDSLGRLPVRNAQRQPARVALSRRVGEQWVDVTTTEFADQVAAVAKGLIAAGLEAGQAIAIMAPTSYEWTLLDFAVWTAGAVSVPVYESSSVDQTHWMLEDAEVLFAVAADQRTHAVLTEAGAGTGLREVWQLDAGAIDDLIGRGSDIDDAVIGERLAGTTRESIATIIYTSGTTGRPKGCLISHGNLLSVGEQAVARLGEEVLGKDGSTLLFLPLAHVFARAVEVIVFVAEVKMAHSANLASLLPDFATFRPTFILAVPRVFEKIYNKAAETTQAEGKGRIFQAAADTAIAWSKALDTGRVPLLLSARHKLFDVLVYSKLRAKMGGRVRYAISGGAPLGQQLGHFFRGLGVNILEGYGLTETTAPIGVVVPEKIKIGTVGPPLPGMALRIAEDGEVLTKGLFVFQGYHKNPTATAEAFTEDGWLRTGDLGSLDEDGYLSITGRKKELIVTAGGKNVAPAVLEDQLRLHPLISQIVVVGDQKPFIAAIITLDPEMYPGWARNNGLADVSLEQARTHPVVLAELQRAVDEANKAVSKAESIRKFTVLDGELTEASGHLTPSLKIRRNVVMRDFAETVEGLYR